MTALVNVFDPYIAVFMYAVVCGVCFGSGSEGCGSGFGHVEIVCVSRGRVSLSSAWSLAFGRCYFSRQDVSSLADTARPGLSSQLAFRNSLWLRPISFSVIQA